MRDTLQDEARQIESPRLLVIDTFDPQTMLHSIVSDFAAEFDVQECQDEKCDEVIAKGSHVAAALINANRRDALTIAARIYRQQQAYIIFVRSEQSGVDFSQFAQIANEWTVTRRNASEIARALALALRAQEQRQRLRTKLHLLR